MADIVLPGGTMFGGAAIDYLTLGSIDGITLSSSSSSVTFIYQIPATGSITGVGITVNSVTTGDTIRVQLQTVSSTGLASGSAYQGCGTVDFVIVGTGAYEGVFSSPAAAVAGEYVALKVWFPAWVAGNLKVAFLYGVRCPGGFFPYLIVGTSKQSYAYSPNAWLSYNGAYYYTPDIGCFVSTALTSIATNTDPDEHGLYFKLPVAGKIAGAKYYLYSNNVNTAYSIVLYDSDGSTVLASKAHQAGAWNQSASGVTTSILFDAPISIAADTYYRLVVKPTTTNTLLFVKDWTVNSAAILDQTDGGQNFIKTTRVDGGAWTEVTTKKPVMAPLMYSISSSAGGIKLPHSLNGGFQ